MLPAEAAPNCSAKPEQRHADDVQRKYFDPPNLFGIVNKSE